MHGISQRPVRHCRTNSPNYGTLMTDIVPPETRSRMMSGIRGKDTRPELALRRALYAAGFRYRLHVRSLPGKPDVVLPKYTAVCLVHGCYWHRHPDCPYATTPATRPEFWTRKFRSNVERDKRQLRQLQAMGWRVAVIWECALNQEGPSIVVERLSRWLHGQAPTVEVG